MKKKVEINTNLLRKMQQLSSLKQLEDLTQEEISSIVENLIAKEIVSIIDNNVKTEQKDAYAYPTIDDYEKITGFKVNESFKIGWRMARTKDSMLQHITYKNNEHRLS